MKQLTKKEAKSLELEINHIIDSGVNSIRLIGMIDQFLENRKLRRLNEWKKFINDEPAIPRKEYNSFEGFDRKPIFASATNKAITELPCVTLSHDMMNEGLFKECPDCGEKFKEDN